MDEYRWGIYGYPTEDCRVEELQSVKAYAWSGDFDNLSVSRYDFQVGKPDPRSSVHTIIGLRRVTHPVFCGHGPSVEIQLQLQGNCTTNSWEQFRVLAYDTAEELSNAFDLEMPWAGTPIFK